MAINIMSIGNCVCAKPPLDDQLQIHTSCPPAELCTYRQSGVGHLP